jgi:hypothetical protein
MSYAQLIPRLRAALGLYRTAIDAAPDEDREDLLRVVGHAEQVLTALESADLEAARLELYAFSRQVSDSFAVQPSQFKGLANEIAAIRREIV